jgi:hypothetical protein
MSDNCSYHDIVELLNRHKQQHLLAFNKELSDADRQRLRSQISRLDFSAIPGWVRKYVLNTSSTGIGEHFEPAPCYPATPVSEKEKEKYRRAVQQGEDLISAGRVAAFVVAGSRPVKNYGLTGLQNILPVKAI